MSVIATSRLANISSLTLDNPRRVWHGGGNKGELWKNTTSRLHHTRSYRRDIASSGGSVTSITTGSLTRTPTASYSQVAGRRIVRRGSTIVAMAFNGHSCQTGGDIMFAKLCKAAACLFFSIGAIAQFYGVPDTLILRIDMSAIFCAIVALWEER